MLYAIAMGQIITVSFCEHEVPYVAWCNRLRTYGLRKSSGLRNPNFWNTWNTTRYQSYYTDMCPSFLFYGRNIW